MNRILALVTMTLVVVALAWFSIRWFDRDVDRFASDSAKDSVAATADAVGGARRAEDSANSARAESAPGAGDAVEVSDPERAPVTARPPAASFRLGGRAVDATGAPLAGVSVRIEELGVALGRPGGAERREVEGDAAVADPRC